MSTLKAQLKEKFGQLGFSLDSFQIGYPTNQRFGDYSTNLALVLAKQKGKSPVKLAQEIVGKLQSDDFFKETFERMEAVPPGFINFYLGDRFLEKELMKILEKQGEYGQLSLGAGKKILVEYSSPNTNKPLHLGHLRNNFLGMSIGLLLKALGWQVLLTEIVNDRGIHICKSMLAYKLWGQGDSPAKSKLKSDHFVAKYYVLFAREEKKKPQLLEQARQMLRDWEAGDKETRKLWRKLNEWAVEGIKQTYEKIGSRFDFRDWESRIYNQGKELIFKAKAKGLVTETEDGAIVIDLSQYDFGGREKEKVLIRSDGTAMYITQDIYLAVKRWQKYQPEKILYVVGDEQIYHFQVLFKVLELLGYGWARDRLVHIAYGQVNLPAGRMKSREGIVVDADDLIAEIEELAQLEIKKRGNSLSQQEIDQRARTIALAALKFFILKVDPGKTIVYNPEVALDFEGATGSYLLYTYARLRSILRKVGENNVAEIRNEELEAPPQKFSEGQATSNIQVSKLVHNAYRFSDLERAILVWLVRFPEVIERAGLEYKPHYLAEYVYDLARLVNSWYTQAPVLKASPAIRQWRLLLIGALEIVLRKGLNLLNIETLEEM